MLDFSNDYFHQETKCDFVIPSFMKRIWASQLEILYYIDLVCKENEIKYYAHWGTLLGAVRHKGFIPWDDDMDLCMLREDYNKFTEIFPKTDNNLILNNPFVSTYCLQPFSRVINSKSVRYDDEEFMSKNHGSPFITGIDIFPLDNIPDSEEEFDTMERLYKLCIDIALDRTEIWDYYTLVDPNAKAAIDALGEMCGVKFTYDNKLRNQIVRLADNVSGAYGADLTVHVTDMYYELGYTSRKLFFNRNCYENIEYIPFENTKIPVPGNYKEILDVMYGSDWEIPKSYKLNKYAESYINQINVLHSQNIHIPEIDSFLDEALAYQRK